MRKKVYTTLSLIKTRKDPFITHLTKKEGAIEEGDKAANQVTFATFLRTMEFQSYLDTLR